MNTQDQKQYQLMKNYIEQYENGSLKLDRLINLLDALIEVLETPQPDWKENFRSEWWTLEQIYSLELETGNQSLEIESQNLIKDTIFNLKSLLKEVSNSLVIV